MKRLLLRFIRFYRREAVEKYGAAKGGWLAFKRLMRCHPFHHHKGGWYDPVP